MLTMMRGFLLVPLLFYAFFTTGGRAVNVQLPHQITSRMSGEWGIVVQTPCRPFIIGETVTFTDGTAYMQSVNVNFTGALEGTVEHDASGLRAFAAGADEEAVKHYIICGERLNALPTEYRPGFEGEMRMTQLVEYVGHFSKPGNAASECGTIQPSVFIRAIGSDARGLKSDSWRAKQTLQYVELEFVANSLTASCVHKKDVTEDEGSQGSTNRRNAGRRRRGHRVSRGVGAGNNPQGATDQRAYEGSIIIGLTRRKPPEKGFYEQYSMSIFFGVAMFVFRIVQAFKSYRRESSAAR
ncbi:hypothetical protein, conserved [Trypanosoma brucei brucei TREU927]|uniref:Uncharacterized protein n=1 Tax=Trypanosoma brucei brucei (strain 927/4 GUTat10.1) TaxID=185431 RepID=Q57WU7_TRYB2|nr:hypothetical protein, conserved [Trypanosoma brucei brucei TREU927]AAX69920.1 hypothetical protein, conserved [Trypanosoma brucei]AAZ10101.1 hypothetical protein, conserved [Trypanosoma brucei brucei TREU927]